MLACLKWNMHAYIQTYIQYIYCVTVSLSIHLPSVLYGIANIQHIIFISSLLLFFFFCFFAFFVKFYFFSLVILVLFLVSCLVFFCFVLFFKFLIFELILHIKNIMKSVFSDICRV